MRLSLLNGQYLLTQLATAWGLWTGVLLTYGTWLFVTCFIVHSISGTRLSTVLRGGAQTLPLSTLKTSATGLRAQWPLGPAGPAACDWAQARCLTFSYTTAQCVCARVTSPGHSVLLHIWVSLAPPTHPLPPFCGGGLLQRRSRAILPSPHVVVHADQGDQRPQFPSDCAGYKTSTERLWKVPGKVSDQNSAQTTATAPHCVYDNVFPIMIPISKIHLSHHTYFCAILWNFQFVLSDLPINHKKNKITRKTWDRWRTQSDVLPLRSHFSGMQLRVWTDGPAQAGLMPLQDRPLCWPPRPQVTEQWVHSDHGDHPFSLSLKSCTHMHFWYTLVKSLPLSLHRFSALNHDWQHSPRQRGQHSPSMKDG